MSPLHRTLAPPAIPPTIDGEGDRRRAETILVADDEDCVLFLVGQILGALGYNVILATGGAEALLRLAQSNGPIDLLITDVNMPEMSGPELLERAWAQCPCLPSLIMTGAQGNHTLPQSVPVLAKPFSLDQLAQAVRLVLDSPVEHGPR